MCYKFIKSKVGRLCTIALTIAGSPATSRRGPPTSRRQILTLSVTSRRGFTRRDVKFICLCHVATWNSHVATSLLHVATWIGTGLCHVATWTRTSRRHLVTYSVTSRRGPERRDVGLFALCDVATSPRTSRHDPVFSPRTVHFGPYLPHPLPETLAFLPSCIP